MTEPTPDLFDICVVLNEATDAPLGSDLLPYARRVKAIVLDALIAEAREAERTYSNAGFIDVSTTWGNHARWIDVVRAREDVQP